MNSLLERVMPDAISLIRMDHTHVLASFHQYRSNSAPRVKQGLVESVCLALEVHAQLEEEIFYPALRAVTDVDFLAEAPAEHDAMRHLMTRLRGLSPTDPAFDEAFHALMRQVMHHVAEEETKLLPQAERLLGDRLAELGGKMARRRLALMAPRTGEMARSMVRALPATSLALAAGLLAGGLLLGHRAGTRR